MWLLLAPILLAAGSIQVLANIVRLGEQTVLCGHPPMEAKLNQVCEILASRQQNPILVNCRDGQIKLLPEQILYVEVQNHTLCYHTKQLLFHTTGTQSLGKLAVELKDKCGISRYPDNAENKAAPSEEA